jgi:hypothetical protein
LTLQLREEEMPRYGREYDRVFGDRTVPGAWRRGPERMREGRPRYDAELYHRYARQARGRSTQHQHAGGWMRSYDREYSYGYGSGGLYGASMYGGGRYGGDYLGAWVPGGWSAEHGREHAGVRNPGRYGTDFRHFRGAGRYSDPAPTG